MVQWRKESVVKSNNDILVLQRALRYAAEMIAEHSQLYDEVSTADEWMQELIHRAKMELVTNDESQAPTRLFA
jgi:hypothetical protein